VPIALVPEATVSTAEARAALPDEVPHADAAFTASRATLLGAALASGSEELFAGALADRLHEPYRAAGAPLLAEVRADLPAGALGATISGSGPTVIVWVRASDAAICAQELSARYPGVQVLALSVSPRGAHTL
jgi:homoserine kinase